MRNFPNQHAKNMSKPTRWTMQRCYDEWNRAQDRAATKRAERVDTALMIAGTLLVMVALILSIMGT